MPARNSSGQFVRSGGGGSRRNYSRRNPAVDWMSIGGAAAASAGANIAVETFIAPQFPLIGPWAAPALQIGVGFYTMKKAKSRTFGISMMALGIRDAMQAVLGYFAAKAAPPPPASQLWATLPGPFPRPAMSSPLSSGTPVQAFPSAVAAPFSQMGPTSYSSYAGHKQSL